ncbi:MAG TPA: hypothetical protein VHF92_00555 [Geodermatophilus sp.]|nr:hypothetical protein [Geodermatophilus sp.]
MSGMSSGEVVLGGVERPGWWLVVDEEDVPGQIVAGPFSDRAEAGWAAGEGFGAEGVRLLYGIRGADGVLSRRPSPQDWAWLAHLGQQLDRLPDGWDAELSDDDPLITLVVEIAAALCEAGLPLHDSTAAGRGVGGVCLTPAPALSGVIVTWRQHDRMSVDRVQGAETDTAVQQVMNRALADLLLLRGFVVDPFGNAAGHLVRAVA